MRANFSAEYFAFFTIFAQNPVACAELPHSCLPLDSSAFQPITPRFPSMQKRSPPHKIPALVGDAQPATQPAAERDAGAASGAGMAPDAAAGAKNSGFTVCAG